MYRSPRTAQITLSRNQRYTTMSKRAANEFLASARSAFEHSRTRELLVGVNLIHVHGSPAGYPPWSSPSTIPYVAQSARSTAHNTLFMSFQPPLPVRFLSLSLSYPREQVGRVAKRVISTIFHQRRRGNENTTIIEIIRHRTVKQDTRLLAPIICRVARRVFFFQ